MSDNEQNPVGGTSPEEASEGGDKPIIVQGGASPADEPETSEGGDKPIIVQGG